MLSNMILLLLTYSEYSEAYMAPEYCSLPPSRMRTIDIIGVMSDRILAKVKLVNKIPNNGSYWGVLKFKNQCESDFLCELSTGSTESPMIEIIDRTENLYQVEFTMPFSPFNSSVVRYVLQQFRKISSIDIGESEDSKGWKEDSDAFIISVKVPVGHDKDKIANCIKKMKIYIFDDDGMSSNEIDYLHCFAKLGPPKVYTTATTTTTSTSITTSSTTTTTTTTSPTTPPPGDSFYIVDAHDPIDSVWLVNSDGAFETASAVSFDCPLKFASTFYHQDNVIIVSNLCNFIYYFDNTCGLTKTTVATPFPNQEVEDQMTTHLIDGYTKIYAHNNGVIRSLSINNFPVSSATWKDATTSGQQIFSRGFAPYKAHRLLLFGGSSGGAHQNRVDDFNAKHNFWQQTKYVPDMPNIRKRAIALSLDFAKIVVVGGLENSSYDRKSNVWIMENDVWTAQGNMLNVRSFPTLQKLDSDNFLVIGGFSGSMPIERVNISTGNPVSEAKSAEGAFQSRPIFLPNCPALPYEITVLG